MKEKLQHTLLQSVVNYVSTLWNRKAKIIALCSVIYRRDYRLQKKTHQVNALLHIITQQYQRWDFLNNYDIMNKQLWKDGLHLNMIGTIQLAENITDFISGLSSAKQI